MTLEEIRKKNVDFARTDIGMYYQIFSSYYIFKINTKTNFRKILLTSSKGIEETVWPNGMYLCELTKIDLQINILFTSILLGLNYDDRFKDLFPTLKEVSVG